MGGPGDAADFEEIEPQRTENRGQKSRPPRSCLLTSVLCPLVSEMPRLRPYLILTLLWAVYFHPLLLNPGGVLYADYSDFSSSGWK